MKKKAKCRNSQEKNPQKSRSKIPQRMKKKMKKKAKCPECSEKNPQKSSSKIPQMMKKKDEKEEKKGKMSGMFGKKSPEIKKQDTLEFE